MKIKILKNLLLSIFSVLIVSTVVYGALGWWEWVENADTWESLTATVWNSFVDGVVKKTGSVAETITWVKTFSSSPIVPTPTTATEVANKQYVDTKVWNTGNEIIAWVKTFSSSPISISPTASWELATKGYVDSSISVNSTPTYVESSNITFTTWTVHSFAHGFWSVPKKFGAYGVVVTATCGFSVWDRIIITTQDGDGARQMSIYANTTNVSMRASSNTVFECPNSANVSLTNSQFRLILWAEN